MTRKPPFNRQIADEAAVWAIALDDDPLSSLEREELIVWLRASPRHVEELLTALALYEGVTFSDPGKSAAIEDILAEASGNVVALDQKAGPAAAGETPVARPARSRRVWWIGVLSAAASLVVGVFTLTNIDRGPAVVEPQPLVVATELGEQRSVTLDDGSIVYVNTQSRISALYTEEERTVELVYGEALFDVEHDPERPFRVIAGDTVAEALGTTFNVRFIDQQAEVSVVEGRVAFGKRDEDFSVVERPEPVDASGTEDAALGLVEEGRVILTAGQRVNLAELAPAPLVAPTNVDAVTAWTTRKLVFHEEALPAIAAEFNRYNRERLVVSSSLLEGERFSGTFAADDPDSFVAFLELTTGIRAMRVGNEIRLREAP